MALVDDGRSRAWDFASDSLAVAERLLMTGRSSRVSLKGSADRAAETSSSG